MPPAPPLGIPGIPSGGGPRARRRRHGRDTGDRRDLPPRLLPLSRLLLLLAAALALPRPAQAEVGAPLPEAVTLSRPEAAGRRVDEIALRGLDRTRAIVVRRELLIAPGRPLDLDELDESVQRLNNLGIFRLVTARLVATAKGGVRVVLTHDEKWTLLPIFTAGRGGGLLHLMIGAMETHLLGRYIETGAYYGYLGGTHSGVLWLADPRLLHRRLSGRLQVGVDNRVRARYGEDGALLGAWARRRAFLLAEVQGDVDPRWLRLGAALIVGQDTFGEELLSGPLVALNRRNGLTLPRDRRDVIARLDLRLGRVNRTDYFVHGQALRARVSLAPSWLGAERPFAKATLTHDASARIGATGNLVSRLTVGAISGAVPERMFYVGGLLYRRGFADSRFAGTWMWNLNLEARVSSLHRRVVALQHVLFTDLGALGDGGAALVEESRRPPLSVGTGVRLVLPLIANFVARLDVAMAFDHGRQWRVSFGSQQFF